MNQSINPIKAQQKREKLAKRSRIAKKAIVFLTVAMCIMSLGAMTAFAATGKVNTTDFINKTITVLQSVVSLIGGGLGVWGVVNLIEGYGGDNAAAKSQGMKQFVAGLGLVILGIVVVPVLGTMIKSAM